MQGTMGNSSFEKSGQEPALESILTGLEDLRPSFFFEQLVNNI